MNVPSGRGGEAAADRGVETGGGEAAGAAAAAGARGEARALLLGDAGRRDRGLPEEAMFRGEEGMVIRPQDLPVGRRATLARCKIQKAAASGAAGGRVTRRAAPVNAPGGLSPADTLCGLHGAEGSRSSPANSRRRRRPPTGLRRWPCGRLPRCSRRGARRRGARGPDAGLACSPRAAKRPGGEGASQGGGGFSREAPVNACHAKRGE